MSNPAASNPAVPQPVAHASDGNAALEAAILNALGARSVVLVGMMGAGKSSIGRRLATRLYRQPVEARALQTLNRFYEEGRARAGFEEGIRTTIEYFRGRIG